MQDQIKKTPERDSHPPGRAVHRLDDVRALLDKDAYIVNYEHIAARVIDLELALLKVS